MRGILLTKGKIAHVDDDLFKLIKSIPWHLSGRYAARHYLENGIDRYVKMHRFIWEYKNGNIPTGMEIDHINGDCLDNRIENLRVVTPSENQKNKHYKRWPKTNREIGQDSRRGPIKSNPNRKI